MEINQAVILVGGKGERLKPLTDNMPKPMVEVCGRPFLEYLLLLLKGNEIRNLLFLAGYLGGKIETYFGDGRKWGVKIDYSFEKEPVGTGGALKLAKDKLEDEFFLLFGDSYLPINYMKMANEYTKSKKKAVLAIYDNREDTGVPFNVTVDKSKKIISLYDKGKGNTQSFNYCDAGVAVVNKEVLSLVRGKMPISFEEETYPKLIAKGGLGYYIAENRFYDIGAIGRIKNFEKYILEVAKNDYHKDSF